MQHTITHVKPWAAGFALAFLLLVPATAQATPSSDQEAVNAVQNGASFAGSSAVAVGSSMRLAGVEDDAGQPANRRSSRAATPGLSWRDGAIGMGILIGFALFGLWGDVAVAAVLVGVDVLIGAAATLAPRTPRNTRPGLRSTAGGTGRVAEKGTAVPSTTR